MKKAISVCLFLHIIIGSLSLTAASAAASGEVGAVVDFTVTVEAGRSARVLQLTDTQIIDAAQARYDGRLNDLQKEYWASGTEEENCKKYVRRLIEKTQPDLILLTGDLVYGEFDDAGTAFSDFVDFMDSFQTPWAPVFGNHDNESKIGVDRQCALLEGAEYCLFKQRELTGNGNYTVGIVQNGKLTRVFFMLDSNGCSSMSDQSKANGHGKTSVGFGKDQTEWYNAEIGRIKAVLPETKISFAFHIQPLAFSDAFAKYGFTNSDTINNPINLDLVGDMGDFGYIGRDLKSPWDGDYAVWNNLVSLGVDSVFVGHEHCNSASVMYNGIRVQYGQKSSTYDRANYLSDTGEIVGSYTKVGTPIIGGSYMEFSETSGNFCDCRIVLYDKTDNTVNVSPVACAHAGETHINGIVKRSCTIDGYTGDVMCDECGEIVVHGISLNALGHIGEKSGNGYEVHCTRCGLILTENKPPLNDDENEQGNGDLIAINDKTADSTTENSEISPQTKDGSKLSVRLIMLLLSAVGAVSVIRGRKKSDI